MDCFLLHERNENLCFALIDGAELSEVRSKLAVVIASPKKSVGIGLADQLTVSPTILSPE